MLLTEIKYTNPVVKAVLEKYIICNSYSEMGLELP